MKHVSHASRIAPNIVFITDDQHRWDYVEMTGRFPVRTPALARLAREGIWYRQVYSTCPLCMPARASLHNGLYAHQTGLDRNVGHWPFGIPMLPGVLRAHGYRTAAIGKLHVYEAVPEKLDLLTVGDTVRRELGYDELFEVSGKALAYYADCEWTHELRRRGVLERYRDPRAIASNEDRPFDLDPALYQDVFIADRAVQWLEQAPTDRPFFLWAGLVSPHPPFDAPASYLERQAPEAQPAPVEPGRISEAAWRLRRRHYAAMVELVDEQVGRMLATLDRRGLADNTLVIFTSDHGEMLMDHGLSGKCFPHDPSVRVPCLMRWPGRVPAGVVSDALVEIIDLPVTCLEAATGDPQPARLLPGSAGRSLAPHWASPSSRHRDEVYGEDGGQFCPPFQMIRNDHWKYVFYPRTGEERLFDMVTDPDECRDLSGHAALAAQRESLKSTLQQRLASTPVRAGVPVVEV